jgi:hypothetical protein
VLVNYDACLGLSLLLGGAAAGVQFVLAFTPRFSVLTLGNAVLLAGVFAPLTTNRLDLGTQVGGWLLLGNCLCFFLLMGRWATSCPSAKAGRPALASLSGLLAFGLHLFVFAACP